MQKSIVVTGVNGFVGQHLVKELIDNGHSVIGIGRDKNPVQSTANLLQSYVEADLTDSWQRIEEKVDAIIHLAGLAAVGPSFDNPQTYINANSSMVTNMCEYYVKQSEKPRIVIISSGAVYDSNQPMPITESSRVAFGSPYAISKVLNENQAAYYASRGLECVVMRPFNHIGPGQLPGFLVPDLADKVLARPSDNEPISVGNLQTKRDYTDVRDVVKAYSAVACSEAKPKRLIYNVCSGESISGETILSTLARVIAMPEPSTDVDPSLIRPNDVMDIRGDNSALVNEFGWRPNYSLEQTLSDFVSELKSR